MHTVVVVIDILTVQIHNNPTYIGDQSWISMCFWLNQEGELKIPRNKVFYLKFDVELFHLNL
jgi:hypothetical protein